MAYAITTKAILSPFMAVAWPFHIQLADKSADVINPSVDFGRADYWAVVAKFKLKASNNTVAVTLEFADALAGTGNVNEIASSPAFPSGVLGTRWLVGWGDVSQRYLNVNVTLGGTATFDMDIYGTTLA